MLTSLALIFLTGLLLASLFEKLKLPRIIGMLLAGILLGPYVLNLLDDSVLSISSDLRQMALIIILFKAGLSLNLSDLKKVGRPAILMSFVPATFEIIGYVLLAPTLLGISKIEAAVMGSVLAAVSPAVVIPRMVQLMETNYGTEKSIPQLIMAGASCDDIFVIVLFSTFSSMAQGGSANIMDFVNIPVSILLGIVIGAIIGYLLALFFETCHRQGHSIRSSLKVLILLSLAFLCMALENRLKGIIAISGLLAVVSMACVVKLKSPIDVTNRLSLKFGKLWIAAEILLFVLAGAAVDIEDDGGAVDGIRVAAAEGVAHVAKVGKADIVIAVFKIEQGLSGAHVLNGRSIGGHFQTKSKADVRNYAVLLADLHCLSPGGGDQFLFTADGHCRFTVHHVRTGERGEQEIPPEFVVQGSVVRPVRQEITHLFQKSLAGFAQSEGIRLRTCRRRFRRNVRLGELLGSRRRGGGVLRLGNVQEKEYSSHRQHQYQTYQHDRKAPALFLTILFVLHKFGFTFLLTDGTAHFSLDASGAVCGHGHPVVDIDYLFIHAAPFLSCRSSSPRPRESLAAAVLWGIFRSRAISPVVKSS